MRLFNELATTYTALSASGLGLEYTGRYLVLLEEGGNGAAIKTMEEVAKLDVAMAATDAEEIPDERVRAVDGVVFNELGVALVDASAEQIGELARATTERSPILAVERERVLVALEAPETRIELNLDDYEVPPEYRRGYRDAVLDLTQSGATTIRLEGAVPQFTEESMTWGLQAIGIGDASGGGTGVSVAVLDTGCSLAHPDLANRSIQSESFISGETVEDLNGHGTHCIGTACGPREPNEVPRYGIAHESAIFVAKVLNNQGSGGEGGILAGLDWARRNGCAVASLSLGAPVRPDQAHSSVFEQVARRVLAAGTLVVAAAGNDSRRQSGITRPVSYPANCPSVLSVGAIDENFRIATFSNQGINPQGGEVDLVAPGVRIRSSWPNPLYNTINGTSMATPHVAGIAALYAEAFGVSGQDLADGIKGGCKPIGLPRIDAGAGLVQAPQGKDSAEA
jgi:subtilisin family serine protease